MRFLAYAFGVVGAGLLLRNLTALWRPIDADWGSAATGVALVVLGAIISGYFNVKENE